MLRASVSGCCSQGGRVPAHRTTTPVFGVGILHPVRKDLGLLSHPHHLWQPVLRGRTDPGIQHREGSAPVACAYWSLILIALVNINEAESAACPPEHCWHQLHPVSSPTACLLFAGGGQCGGHRALPVLPPALKALRPQTQGGPACLAAALLASLLVGQKLRGDSRCLACRAGRPARTKLCHRRAWSRLEPQTALRAPSPAVWHQPRRTAPHEGGTVATA